MKIISRQFPSASPESDFYVAPLSWPFPSQPGDKIYVRSDLPAENRQGRKPPHPGSARYAILMPVQYAQTVQPLCSVQTFNSEMAWPKLALLYWICRRSDKGRGRARIKAMVVICERGTCPRGTDQTACFGLSEELPSGIGESRSLVF